MKTFIIIFTIFFSLSLLAQDSSLIWDKDNKLSWNDFKEPVVKGVSMLAESHTEIRTHYHNVGNDSIFISVEARFYTLSSWAKKDLINDYLLNHEQRHFDIAELFARKLRKELLNSHISVSRISYDIDAIINKIVEQERDKQIKYDKETIHSMNKETQAKWNKYIDEQLKALESYKDPEIMMKIEY